MAVSGWLVPECGGFCATAAAWPRKCVRHCERELKHGSSPILPVVIHTSTAGSTSGTGQVFYIGSSTPGTVFGLRLTAGAVITALWRFHTLHAITGVPVIGPHGVLLVGSGDGYMYALRGEAWSPFFAGICRVVELDAEYVARMCVGGVPSRG